MNPPAGLSLTHFQAFLLFAAIISISFGYLGRRRPPDRVRYIPLVLLPLPRRRHRHRLGHVPLLPLVGSLRCDFRTDEFLDPFPVVADL